MHVAGGAREEKYVWPTRLEKVVKYEGQRMKPELNTYVCSRPVSRCQRLVLVNMYTYVCMSRVGREGENTYGPRG